MIGEIVEHLLPLGAARLPVHRLLEPGEEVAQVVLDLGGAARAVGGRVEVTAAGIIATWCAALKKRQLVRFCKRIIEYSLSLEMVRHPPGSSAWT